MTPEVRRRIVLIVLGVLLALGAAGAEAVEQWVLGSFSADTAMGSRWTDEAALGSFEQCMDLLRTAVESDAGTLRFAGATVSQTANTVTGWDPRSKRRIAYTVYSCRRDWRPSR
jgi:hypothetical protein